MKKKITAVLIFMLSIATVLQVAEAINVDKLCSVSVGPKQAQNTQFWSDDFDDYYLGQFLDGDPEDGGWKGWDNNPTWGAYVVDDEANSTPHSVDVVDVVAIVHEYSGADLGHWMFTTWQFIPDTFVGLSRFVLLNTYSDMGDKSWSTSIRFDSDQWLLESEFDGAQLPLISGRWVELRVEINLHPDQDWQRIYYDGELLVNKSWTDGVSHGGELNIGAVALLGYGSSSIYYDDMSLDRVMGTPDLQCWGELSWIDVSPGSIVEGNFTIGNVGDNNSELDWMVSDWPDWGDWTFYPDSGEGLTPNSSPVEIEATVVAPDQKNKEFTGEVKVVNMENPDDFCTILVYLKTPVNSPFLQFLEFLMQRIPILGHILNLIL